jgi:hypothetical protein
MFSPRGLLERSDDDDDEMRSIRVDDEGDCVDREHVKNFVMT